MFRENLGREIYHQVEQVRDGPLPPSFSLPNLPAKLLSIARFISSESVFQEPPKKLTSSLPGPHALQVREIQDRPSLDRPLPDCFLCGQKHYMADCPTFVKVQENPRALGALKQALKVRMLASGDDDDAPPDATPSNDDGSDGDHDGPIVAETVYDDDDTEDSDASDFPPAGHH